MCAEKNLRRRARIRAACASCARKRSVSCARVSQNGNGFFSPNTRAIFFRRRRTVRWRTKARGTRQHGRASRHFAPRRRRFCRPKIAPPKNHLPAITGLVRFSMSCDALRRQFFPRRRDAGLVCGGAPKRARGGVENAARRRKKSREAVRKIARCDRCANTFEHRAKNIRVKIHRTSCASTRLSCTLRH
jgi:hypothetical protein